MPTYSNRAVKLANELRRKVNKMSEEKKDVVWVVTHSEQYESDITLAVTTNRGKALEAYESAAKTLDKWTAVQLERWENGEFVEHEMETD